MAVHQVWICPDGGSILGVSDESTTTRVLRLLGLLQSRRTWPGPELAERLGVTARTLRRDVERVRALGYRVDADRGSTGGYRLAAGTSLPPLLLSDEEAVTLAVSLQTTAVNGSSVGMAETGLEVLAKLEPVLPRRLQRRISALRAATSTLPTPAPGGTPVHPDLLVALAQAIRDRRRVALAYQAADGTRSAREVEPTALVPRSRRWYLVCWDQHKHDWRTLRIDRITGAETTGASFLPRRLPADNAAAFVAAQFREQTEHAVEVLVHAGHSEVQGYLRGYAKDLEPHGSDRTRWTIRAEHMESLIGTLTWLPWDYTVNAQPDFMVLLRATAQRMDRASTRPPTRTTWPAAGPQSGGRG